MDIGVLICIKLILFYCINFEEWVKGFISVINFGFRCILDDFLKVIGN